MKALSARSAENGRQKEQSNEFSGKSLFLMQKSSKRKSNNLQSNCYAIKQFSKETKDAEVIAASSKITSKDVLFYYLAQNAILEKRVTRIETTQKMSLWFTGIAISVIGLFIAVIKI